MRRWMCNKTRKDRIRNEQIRETLKVAPIVEKMRENRLRWFGHVQRMPPNAPLRTCDDISLNQARGRGRPKLTWTSAIRKDMKDCDLYPDLALDCVEWRKSDSCRRPQVIRIKI